MERKRKSVKPKTQKDPEDNGRRFIRRSRTKTKTKPATPDLVTNEYTREFLSYKDSYPELAQTLCSSGATEFELSEAFQVRPSIIYKWCRAHPEFGMSFKTGSDLADHRVEAALYAKAIGYQRKVERVSATGKVVTVIETRIPDLAAVKMWLFNRKPEVWKERQTQNGEAPTVQYLIDPTKLKGLTLKDLEKMETVLQVLTDGPKTKSDDDETNVVYMRDLK